MKPRFNLAAMTDAYKAMLGLETYLAQCSLEHELIHLIKLRVSQINGCAYCIDMHWKDARALGVSEQKLYGLDAWEEAPYYNDRERAALAWAEALTLITDGHASDEAYAAVKAVFTDEKQLGDLTFAIATINAWNRLAIAARSPAGGYKSPHAR